nr:histidine kinase [uncultured Blautia sp.]
MKELKESLSVRDSIQNRLSFAMVVVMVFVMCINFFIFEQIHTGVDRIDAVFSSNAAINDLSDTLNKLEGTVYEYLNTKGSKSLENYYRYEQDYRELLDEFNDRNVDSEVKMLEKNIRRMSESYLDQTNETVQAKRGRNIEKYKTSYEKETQLYEYINSYIYKLNNLRFRMNSSNYQILLSSMDVLYRLALVVIFIVAAVGVAIIILVVRSMIRPLTQLSITAHEVARGNLNVPVLPVIREDEVGVVTRGFNQMLDSIRLNIRQQRESMEKQAQMKERELLMETHLKEAQLKYLQAQINPHFLFNCLNAGAQLAMLEDAERTGVFLEKMADFFRYNVRKMEDDALLWEEVEAVDNYIYILNVRFAGDIHYEKDVDEGIGDVRIPSMILQPLVENAIQHGIHDCMENGKVRMSIHRGVNVLEITVSDNGAGMTAEMIDKVMAGKARNKGEDRYSTGIAVGNVIDRLELYYKQNGLLTIESGGPGTGTSVHITLPVEVESDRD